MNTPITRNYVVLRTIAKDLNTTSHGLGQLLCSLGYRYHDGCPTGVAMESLMAQKYTLACGLDAWSWDYQQVMDLCKKHPPPPKATRKPRRESP